MKYKMRQKNKNTKINAKRNTEYFNFQTVNIKRVVPNISNIFDPWIEKHPQQKLINKIVSYGQQTGGVCATLITYVDIHNRFLSK